MEMNFDCIRAIMLYLEEHTAIFENEKHVMEFAEIRGRTIVEDLINLGYDFQPEEIFYVTYQLLQADMLVGEVTLGARHEIITMSITDLSWQGHEFAGTIKDNTTWDKIKNVATQTGAKSLNAIWDIGKQVLTLLIKEAVIN